MREFIKAILAYAGLIGMSITWLAIFGCMFIYGSCALAEPNIGILTVETILCAGMIVLGIERFRSLIRKHRDRS